MKLFDRLRGEGLGAELARGAAGSFAVKSAGVLVLLASQVLLTRLLGAEQYGVYRYVISWITVLVVLAKLGLDSVLVRFVAAYNSAGDWRALRGILQRSNRLVILMSVGVSLALAGVVLALGERIDMELRIAFLVGCLLLPVMSLIALREASLQGLKRVVLAQLPSRVLSPLILALAVGAAYLFIAGQFNGTSALWCTLLAYVLSFGASSYWLGRSVSGPVKEARPLYHSRLWLTVGVGMLAVSGQFLIMNRIDILMLGLFAGKSEVGVYAVAARLAWMVTFMLEAVSAIGAPLISELFSKKSMVDLQRLVHRMIGVSALFSAALFGVLAFGGGFLLGIFGPEFTAGYVPLAILAAGQLFNSLTGPLGLLLTMTGHEKKLGALLFLALALNIILNYLLIPGYGMLGAAVATTAVNVLWNTASVVLVYRLLGIWSLPGVGGRKG
ncbi:MAG TPA: flippase [archaeon]|nr:flippase [archaeon]